MLYKLIIADDEVMIAYGLRDLFPWEQLGFQVEQVFTDGQDIIRYLGENEVHAVLTDIHMSCVGGMEIAQYVRQHKLPIAVILISAYHEFNYAKQAIDYGVYSYILKPTKIQEIQEVFSKLRLELDEKEQISTQEIELKEQNETMEALLIRQFFLDLYYGSIAAEKDIVSRLEEVKLPSELCYSPCCLFHLAAEGELVQLKAMDHFIRTAQPISQSELFNTLLVYPLTSDSTRITCLAVKPAGCETIHSIQQLVEEMATKLRSQAAILFSVQLELTVEACFENMPAFAAYLACPQQAAMAGGNTPKNLLNTLEKRMAKLREYLFSQEWELASNMLETLFKQIGTENPYLLRSVMRDVLYLLLSLLPEEQQHTVRPTVAAATQQEDTALLLLQTKELLALFGGSIKPKETSGEAGLELVLKYIAEHYHEDLFLDVVAEQLNINAALLSRTFKRKTNESFTQYLLHYRLEKAAELLHQSNHKIYEISQMVGYANIHYFFRLFKRQYGCTPYEYRNKEGAPG